MAVENALTYYDAATVTATKCFIVQGPDVGKARSRLDIKDAYSVWRHTLIRLTTSGHW